MSEKKLTQQGAEEQRSFEQVSAEASVEEVKGSEPAAEAKPMEPSAKTELPTAARQPSARRVGGGTVLGWLLFLVASAVAGGLGWRLGQIQDQMEALQAQTEQLHGSLSAAKQLLLGEAARSLMIAELELDNQNINQFKWRIEEGQMRLEEANKVVTKQGAARIQGIRSNLDQSKALAERDPSAAKQALAAARDELEKLIKDEVVQRKPFTSP